MRRSLGRVGVVSALVAGVALAPRARADSPERQEPPSAAPEARPPEVRPPDPVSAPAPASAPSNASAPAPEAPPARDAWSLGLGVNFASASASDSLLAILSGSRTGLGDPNAILAASVIGHEAPNLALGVERRLGSLVWLGLQLSVSSSDQKTVPDHPNPLPASQVINTTTNDLTHAGAALSGRFVVNPGGAVELAPFVAVAGGYTHLVSTTVTEGNLGTPTNKTTSVADMELKELSGKAGLSAERELIRHLNLRLALSLARVAYSTSRLKATVTPDPGPGNQPNPDTNTSLSGGLIFEPQLMLNVTF